MKVRIQLARNRREYGLVVIEAESVAAAVAKVEALIEQGCDSQEYCDMCNEGDWSSAPEADDEEIIDHEVIDEEEV